MRCISKIHKPKKSKASLSEKQELLDEIKQIRESQERTCALLANFATLIENRFSFEDVNDIIQPATQVYFILLSLYVNIIKTFTKLSL